MKVSETLPNATIRIDSRAPTNGSMSSNGGGGDSSSGGNGTSIDARGQKEVDIQSTQQLWGALVPNVVLGLVYLAGFLYFRRRAAVKDVYDPKRRRLVALAQGRESPTIRGLPEAWKERSPSMAPTPLPPPDVPAKPWSWFLDLWRISDAAIITYTGADAYMFLRFLRVGWVCGFGLGVYINPSHRIYQSSQLLVRACIHLVRHRRPPARPRARGQWNA